MIPETRAIRLAPGGGRLTLWRMRRLVAQWSMPSLGAGLAAALLLGIGMLLWARHGGAVFFETVLSGLWLCF